MAEDDKHSAKSKFGNVSFEGIEGSAGLQQAGGDIFTILQNIQIIYKDNDKICEEKLKLLQQQISLLEPLLRIIDTYSETRKWLSREIEGGLSQEIGNKVLNNENVSEEQIKNFCRTLKNYLRWVEVSLEAGEPINFKTNEEKLRPVLPLEKYLLAVEYVKEKATPHLSSEAMELFSNLLDYLIDNLKRFNKFG